MATRAHVFDVGPVSLTLTLQSKSPEAHSAIANHPREVNASLAQALAAAVDHLGGIPGVTALGEPRERQVAAPAAASLRDPHLHRQG